ncbi:helix-turn-helix transcriptional regulator [Bradyrhizobium diazoefficiens]|nr:AraC family transcriptional regulator [Bradyrhizobium diazoefficiens]UCF55341.1 MAG: helix-turn-helix transcriptional regulator [Bradyrhizobium sp.]MBR0965211.1 helix-turn-helix transcriptional regulator [Bradyrhizobium diazoefficiens]MBR0977608.1 helix-turn-helix transcriptional regulator [Bradyrhizobium diazoefficiens]MBR1007710.1 helix-turn-helix transcriptional regulator [Bradyrhizobium diazoefficiens]MBR1013673.1 helix-turn-helix transcriptional regulator [Bradyrhizobium diazoefficiens
MPGSGGTIYLDRFKAVHSHDSEFARDRMFAVYGADGFDKGIGNFGIHANYAKLSAVGLGFCAYDGPVTVTYPEAGFVRQFFSIQGRASFTTSHTSASIGAWTSIVTGQSRLRLEFGENYRQLVLRIDLPALERTIKALAGDASDKRLEFSEGEANPSSMSFLRRQVFHLAEELETFADQYSPLARAELERDLIVRFLLAHEHNFSDLLKREPLVAGRSVVERIEAFIEANWARPIDLEEIAGIANVSVRTVFREFARAGKGSPAQFAKRVRLQRAAEFLRSPADGTTVTGVAFRCGFQNIGRFAAEYLRSHGELPSETLKRAQASR